VYCLPLLRLWTKLAQGPPAWNLDTQATTGQRLGKRETHFGENYGGGAVPKQKRTERCRERNRCDLLSDHFCLQHPLQNSPRRLNLALVQIDFPWKPELDWLHKRKTMFNEGWEAGPPAVQYVFASRFL
jgi:hypothetical protein